MCYYFIHDSSGAFAPLKNADRLMLRHQFLVPEMPITMAPKLDKIMDTECQSGVKCTDTALARLQALTLDVIGPLSDLEKLAACGNSSLDLKVVEDTVQSALVLQGNTSTQFSMYHHTKVLEDFSKDLISFAEEREPELRGAVPYLYGSAFTKQAADHLEQVETLQKAKRKPKRFFRGPPCKSRRGGKGEQALQLGRSRTPPAAQGNS